MSAWDSSNANSGWGGGGATAADSDWGGPVATADSGWDTGPTANGNTDNWDTNGNGAASGGDTLGMDTMNLNEDGGNGGGDRACFNCGEQG
jgi:hypothetical protein